MSNLEKLSQQQGLPQTPISETHLLLSGVVGDVDGDLLLDSTQYSDAAVALASPEQLMDAGAEVALWDLDVGLLVACVGVEEREEAIAGDIEEYVRLAGDDGGEHVVAGGALRAVSTYSTATC